MRIFGTKCLYCQGNELELLQVVNGAIFTKCFNCGHLGKPEPKAIKNNAVYSKFAKKTVEVEYSRPKTKSGTYKKTII